MAVELSEKMKPVASACRHSRPHHQAPPASASPLPNTCNPPRPNNDPRIFQSAPRFNSRPMRNSITTTPERMLQDDNVMCLQQFLFRLHIDQIVRIEFIQMADGHSCDPLRRGDEVAVHHRLVQGGMGEQDQNAGAIHGMMNRSACSFRCNQVRVDFDVEVDMIVNDDPIHDKNG